MKNPCTDCKRKPNCPKPCYPFRDYQRARKRGPEMENPMNEFCPNCKHRECGMEEYPCRNCAVAHALAMHYEPIDGSDPELTRGDLVRLGTDAELAKLLVSVASCDKCNLAKLGYYCDQGGCYAAFLRYVSDKPEKK